jgi:hypothetical protein
VGDTPYRRFCDLCNRVATHNSPRDIQFIGVDGEGVTRPDGKHEYNLLSVGSRSLYHDDGSVLTWYDIIPFLWDCFTDNPEAIYVGFYLGYDFTHWVRGLPENRARMLLTSEGIALRKRTRSGGNRVPFPVEHRGWEFDFLGFKRFRLRPEGHSGAWFYLCDTGAFFQTSFLNAIDPTKWPDGAILSDSEYKAIQRGKADRSIGVVDYGTPIDPDTLEYNHLENVVLGRLMRKYNEGLTSIGVNLKRDQFFGPGQAAQSWMNSIKAPTREAFESVTTLEVRNACRASYYGGWFEIFAHGHIPGTSYSYDVNSAYPDIQSKLPCILHGEWTVSDTMQTGDYVLVYGTLTGINEYIGAGPHRIRTGNILRPNRTRGWYWLAEIETARQAGLVSSIEIERTMAYTPCDCPPPFAKERTLYLERLRVGKNTINGKARKLVYNSTYGKTAQSIGVAKFANPFYASYITSQCRTYILSAIAHHEYDPSDVLMVATDGITFRHRNRNLALSEETLGAWTETKHSNLTLFMPGVYWDDYTRDKLAEGEAPSLKSRGIPARALAAKLLDIDRMFDDCFSGEGFPVLEIPISFSLVSPKQALARGKWDTCGNVTTDGIRRIDSDPTIKRAPFTTHFKDGIIRTNCYGVGQSLETTPYAKTFGDDEMLALLTDDGELNMLLSGMLGRD